MNVFDFLQISHTSQRTAVSTPDFEFTYGQLAEASAEFASRLLNAGAVKGDRVLLVSANSFHWVASYLGTLSAGMVCVPLPATISAQDLEYVIGSIKARVAFIEKRLWPRCKEIIGAACATILCEAKNDPPYFSDPICNSSVLVPGSCQPQLANLAALMFTSGSTDRPRGVMVSHLNIIANTESIISSLDLKPDDRVMVVLPFHYCFGASLLHTYLKVGGTLVLDNRFTFPEVVLQRIAVAECTSFAGVPSHYQILLRKSTLLKRQLPQLRTMLQAGGHLAPEFVTQLREGLPHVKIFVMYGQTEATARLSCLPSEMLSSKPGSIGIAIPGVTLRVLRPDGEEADPGEVGEIVAEGANIAQGYWSAAEETSQSFRNGRLYTGDLATVDEDGYLFIVDRTKDFIKCGGTRVSCHQIEDQLLRFEELVEAAVIGVPDNVLGEAICAFVVPKAPSDQTLVERIRSFCKASLPARLVPREIIPLTGLPKNSSGKLLRAQLRNMGPSVDPDGRPVTRAAY